MKFFKLKSKRSKALDIINSHCGKKRVYLTYLKRDPKLAEKYLSFIGKNVDATYIHWDKEREAFAG